jgi:hypothetical protein
MTDDEIIKELADKLMSLSLVPPFVFGIYYNAKKEPARVRVHRVTRNGIMGETTFLIRRSARAWCEEALREGYTVVRLLGRDDSHEASLASRKQYLEREAKRAALTPEQRKAIDDEIPF